MPGDNRLVTESFLGSNFTPDSGISPGSDNYLNLDCSQTQGRYQVSIAGITSTGTRCPSQNQLTSDVSSVVHWVMVGGGIATSADGTTWTTRVNSTNFALGRGIFWNGSLFVATGSGDYGNQIITSPDGITWTNRISPFPNTGYCVGWNGSMWVVGGGTSTNSSNANFATSTDGINWTSRFTSALYRITGITYGNGLWVATGDKAATSTTWNTIATSSDGINWTTRTNVFEIYGFDVHYNGSLFVAVGTDNTNMIASSSNGTSWTGRGSVLDSSGRGIHYGNGLWVATGSFSNSIATSTTGTSWAGRGSITGTGEKVRYGGGLWVSVGTGNNYATSSDGINWTTQTFNGNTSYNVCYK